MKKKKFSDTFARMYRNPQYRICLWIFGFFTMLVTYFTFKSKKGKDAFAKLQKELKQEYMREGLHEKFYEDALLQVKKKNEYFKKTISEDAAEKEARAIAERNLKHFVHDKAKEKAEMESVSELCASLLWKAYGESSIYDFLIYIVFPNVYSDGAIYPSDCKVCY